MILNPTRCVVTVESVATAWEAISAVSKKKAVGIIAIRLIVKMYIDFIIVLRKSLFSDILRVAYSLSAFLKMSTNLADLYHSNTDKKKNNFSYCCQDYQKPVFRHFKCSSAVFQLHPSFLLCDLFQSFNFNITVSGKFFVNYHLINSGSQRIHWFVTENSRCLNTIFK